MRATIGRPYSVVVSADKDRTQRERGTYGFVGTFDTVIPQKPYS